jgi:ATP adenylyltransferase
MQRLWAPWRLAYIQGEDESRTDGCVFCVRDCCDDDPGRLILHRGEHAFVVMNKYPYSNGHLLIAPYRHIADVGDLSEEEALEMHRLLVMAKSVLAETVCAQGFNVGMNLGQIAGAGIAEHLHLHIVPRWSGDTNFMPVFADVRVIPQHLEATHRLLLAAFARRRP